MKKKLSRGDLDLGIRGSRVVRHEANLPEIVPAAKQTRDWLLARVVWTDLSTDPKHARD